MSRPGAALEIEDLTVERLAAASEVFAQALAWHGACLGQAAESAEGFEALLPDLQLFAPASEGAPYLHCGLRTTTALIYGREVALAVAGRRTLPGEPSALALSAVYGEAAAAGRPIAQHVRLALTLDDMTHLVAYHRLVLPLSLSLGPAVGVVTRFAHGPGRPAGPARPPRPN
ncbi:MAG: hypothetical protein WD341_09295 [Tistlia sp.]|uniref:hypothetical protein n=1 Tax=Tistlia sp. TaxID=3057121 RepID=UPI0034A0F89B